MVHVPIPPPFKGLSDNFAFSAQPPETSGDLLNVRPFDPITGRRRLSKREGTLKYNASRLSANPVRFMQQVTYDGRKNTYAAQVPSTDLSKTTPKSQEVRTECLDRQGNVYMVDGNASISKVNKDGETVWTFQPPVADPQHVISALYVDSQDNLYVGVSSGGSQATAKFWRFTQEKGSAVPVKKWEEAPNGYVRRIVVVGDTVYVALNQPDRYGGFVVAYTGALDTGLTEAWRSAVAYPVNDMVLNPQGAVLGCSLPFVDRWKDPRFPNFTRKTVDAQPRDILTNFDARVWRWHQGEVLAETLTDGDTVSLWPDISGKGRSLFTSLRTGRTLPRFKLNGVNGIPSVYFRGESTTPAFLDEIQTQYSPSTNSAYSDGANGLVPRYSGAKWVMFVVLRTEQVASRIQSVFGQNATTGATTGSSTLFVNRNDAGVATTGVGSFHEVPQASGSGLGFDTGAIQLPLQFTFSSASGNDSGTCLLTIMSDGGDTTADSGNTVTHSLLRYNGHPLDRWVSPTSASTDAGYVGDSFSTTASEFAFSGEIVEMLVLRDNASATKGLIGHSNYPHLIHARGAAPTVQAYSATTAQDADELLRVEGYFAHKYGIAHLLPRSVESGSAATTQTYTAGPPTVINVAGFWPHPYSLAKTGGGAGLFTSSSGWNGPPRATASLNRSEPFRMHADSGVAWKLDGAKGELQWVLAAGPDDEGAGIGYSISCSNSGEIVYSVGPSSIKGAIGSRGLGTSSTASTKLRAWVDRNAKGEDGYNIAITPAGTPKAWITSIGDISFTGATFDGTVTITGTFTGYVWQSGDVLNITGGTGVAPGPYTIVSGNATTLVLATDPGAANADTAGTIIRAWMTSDIKIDVDDHDNVFVPMAFAGMNETVRVYAREPDGSGSFNVGRLLATYTEAANAKGYAVICPPSPPYRYGTVPPADFARNPTTTVDEYARAEYVWVGIAQTGTLPNTTPGLVKARFVSATPVSGSPRTQTLVQVVNGVVAKFTTSTMASFAGPSTLATPQLSADSNYVDGAIAFNKLFLTDGKGYVYADLINDTVLSYKATNGGQIPERCKLMVNWRGRIVVARGVDQPQNWTMSEMGNPFGWDLFPVPSTATRAISGNNARVGLCPDIINCLIPYTDDVLIFGCDHSIWALVGDPADEGRAAGFTLVSDITGIAFGRPWTKDPEGNLYFFGSRGGVWVMRPGGIPVSLTQETIDARLRDVDLSVYRVELAWDVEYNVLRVFLIPFSGSAEGTFHYVWDREDKGWWSDSYPFSFGSVLAVDGDLGSDRVLVYGGGDGYMRYSARSEKNDDGTAIPVRFLIGPVTPQDAMNKWRFRDFRSTLSETQDSLNVGIYESEVPDDKGTARLVTVMAPGRSRGKPLSACAPYIWVEGKQAVLNNRWSIEAMSMEAHGVGRAHART